MRRWIVLVALLITPASAQAATIACEGTELVYRSAFAQEDSFFITQEDDVARA